MTYLFFKLLLFFGIIFCAWLIFVKKYKWNKLKRPLLFYGLFCFVVLMASTIFPNIPEKMAKKIKNIKQNVTSKTYNSCNCQVLLNELHKDDFSEEHRPRAESTTNFRLISNDQLKNKWLKEGHLISVGENDGYWISGLQYSSAVLTPLAKKRLDELGRRFRASISKESERMSYFVVSSLTRTEVQQERLRRVNPSATLGTSPHSYGVAFDITQVRSRNNNCHFGMLALKNVLIAMQKEGKILLCPESKCIHITVCG